MHDLAERILGSYESDKSLRTVLADWYGTYNIKYSISINDRGADEIELDVHGFLKDQLTVKIVNGKLYVKGSPRSTQDNPYRKFDWSIDIGEFYDKDSISAKLLNGILTIVVPLKNNDTKCSKPKFIEIE